MVGARILNVHPVKGREWLAPFLGGSGYLSTSSIPLHSLYWSICRGLINRMAAESKCGGPTATINKWQDKSGHIPMNGFILPNMFKDTRLSAK